MLKNRTRMYIPRAGTDAGGSQLQEFAASANSKLKIGHGRPIFSELLEFLPIFFYTSLILTEEI